jgi:seryl-tRNA synthetase
VLDLKVIRREPEAVRTGLARRSPELGETIDRLLALDSRWREMTQTAETLRAEQKVASEAIARG